MPDWRRVHYLAMDELALHKGHRDATVVVDSIGRQVLWGGPGRSHQSARLLRAVPPPGVAQRIRAVAIDMTSAYELEIRAHCPQAEIAYGLFHVVVKYGCEVIDRVRVDQANWRSTQPQARRVLKSSRWQLLRKRASLQPQQAVHLNELLQANKPLMRVYVLRDELKQLWFCRQPSQAIQAWQHLCEQAHQSGIDALRAA